MKHITLTVVVEGFLSDTKKPITLHPEHIILIEPEEDGSYIEMYGGKSYSVKESEDVIRKMIADATHVEPPKPAPTPEPPKT